MGTSAISDNNGGLTVTPQTGASGPEKSAVEKASDAARALIASSGTALPPEGSPAPRPGEQPRVPPGVPEGGQFDRKPGEAAPAAGQAPGTEQPKPGEQQPPKPGEAAPGGEETPEAKAAREAAEATAAQKALTVELPIMVGEGADAVPLALTADSPETAAALQQLVEDASGAAEARVLVDNATRQLAEVEEMEQWADADPIGFTIRMIGTDVEQAENLALYLLAQPTLFERLKPQLTKLVQDPNELRALAGDVATKRSSMERAAATSIDQGRAIRSNLQEVQTTVISMLPATLNEAQRRMVFGDCLRDLKDHADRNGLKTLPVHQIPTLLADRLTAHGINPEEAASAAAVALARRGGTASGRPGFPAAPRAPLAKPAAPAIPAKKPNGAAFVSSAAKKVEAGAIPPGGAGSPSGQAVLTPPKKQDGSAMTTEETIAWHRGRLKAGVRTY